MISKGEMIAVADYYLSILSRAGVQPMGRVAAQSVAETEENFLPELSGKSAVVDFSRKLAYCGYMLTEMRGMAQSATTTDRERFIRWLCFIQGVLWSANLRSIEQSRSDIRHIIF